MVGGRADDDEHTRDGQTRDRHLLAAPTRERVDVVDEHDRVLRVVDRAEMRAGRLRHRAVFVAVLHPDGRLLVHQRSDAKDLWPGRWDLAVGGVVASGEGWDDAARREVAEEVGVVGVEPEPLGDPTRPLPYTDDDVALLGRCYRVVHPGPFRFTDGEVQRAEWVHLAELDHLLAERSFLPDSVALLLPLVRARLIAG